MPDAATVQERDLRLGELENLRDLGGYPTRDGRQVRWRRVYRGASLHEALAADPATAADWAALGVRTAVDLRRADERDLRGVLAPDLHLPGSLHLPVQEQVEHPDVDLEQHPVEFLTQAYLLMLDTAGPALRGTFAVLADPERLPLVVFCAAGKDRTGTVVALLLSSLGVGAEHIADDYALSGTRIEAMVARKRAAGADRDPMIDQHPSILRAPREAMVRFLVLLDETYGGADAYLATVGVGADVRDAVRANLTETFS